MKYFITVTGPVVHFRSALVLVAGLALVVSIGPSALGKASGHHGVVNGQIAFARRASEDPDGGHIVYVVDPDGRRLQAKANPADFPRWSPKGKYLALGDMSCMFGGACAAVIMNVDNAKARTLPDPRPEQFDEFLGCTVWSPDGRRLACGGLGSAPGVSGVYTIRAANGKGLTRVLTCDNECGPADYSPDGRHLALVGNDHQGLTQLFTVRIDGTGLHQVTHSDMPVDGDSSASWSPSGNRLLFTRQPDELHRRTIYEVDADGTHVHQVPIPKCGGAFDAEDSVGCFGPSWSPDGRKIAFGRLDPATGIQDIYTADADGTHSFQVTHDTSLLPITTPDWGSRTAR